MSNLRIMQIRSDLKTNGVTSQIIQIATELNQKNIFNIVVTSGGENLSTLMKRNITHIKVPEINIKKRNPYTIFLAIKKIIRVINHYDINVIHSHNAQTAFICNLISKFIPSNVKITQTVHGLEQSKTKIYRNLIYRISNHNIIAISNYTKYILEKFYVHSDKITIIHNGIDINFPVKKTVANNTFGIPKDSFVIGILGVVEGLKGHKLLIDAIDAVITNTQNKSIFGLICGSGSKLNEIIDHHKKNVGNKENIIITGYLDNVHDFYNVIDLFCLPSIMGEMLPIVVLEALSYTKPVIVSSISGLPEIVHLTQMGDVVKRNSLSDLISKINLYLSSNYYHTKISDNHKNFVKYFNKDLMIGKLIVHYFSLHRK